MTESNLITEMEEKMNDKTRMTIMKQREIYKAYSPDDMGAEQTDEEQGLPQPPMEQPKKTESVISLPKDFRSVIRKTDILDIMTERKSHRKYKQDDLTLTELSFLLWSTQGVKKVIGNRKKASLRTVPSAGARHPLETYLFINQVEGLAPGLYHYLPLEHELEYLRAAGEQKEQLTKALCDQEFAGTAPVAFVWSVVPYRCEWRYGTKAQKYTLLDAGHVCQNLYLACEAINCGVCAIGAYDQEQMDELLDLKPGPSGEETYECVIYAASVGKVQD